MPHLPWLRALGGAVLGASTIGAFAGGPMYRVEDLGESPGFHKAYPTAIERHGQVVGYLIDRATGDPAACTFMNGKAIALPGFVASSEADGINRHGVVVGAMTVPAMAGGTTQHAYRWQQGQPQDLGALPGADYSAALAIGDDDTIVGFANIRSGSSHAVVWSGGSMRDLGTLGGDGSVAFGVSHDGRFIVGQADLESGRQHAFITHLGKLVDLGTRAGFDNNSTAWAVNDSGAAGGSATRAFATTTRAARWTPQGGFEDLGILGSGSFAGVLAINDAGTAVGYSDLGDGHVFSRAVIIDAGTTTMVDLNDELDPVTGHGWLLASATGINDAGQIVGRGYHDRRAHAFRLVPMQRTGN